MIFKTQLFENIKKTALLAIKTNFEIFKVLIPISIITKVIQELGIIWFISDPLSPVMNLVGLPGELALVWLTAMVSNIYTGIVIFASLATELDLTIAQVTVLSGMILIADSLLVEVSITYKAGLPIWYVLLLRIGGSLIFGWILYQIYRTTHLHSTPASLSLSQISANSSLKEWMIGEIYTLSTIFFIIFVLHFCVDLLQSTGMTDFIIHRFQPILNIFGMSQRTGPLFLIGMLLGLIYGGGLIISESKQQTITDLEIFSGFTLLSLSHSIIEDTFLMLLVGGDISGVLVGRLIFTCLVSYLLVRLIALTSQEIFYRYFFNVSES